MPIAGISQGLGLGGGTVATISGMRVSWTPVEISTEAWYDASDGGTITESGGDVSQWGDKSGNANHMTAASGEEPTTGSETLNGLNVLSFDGADPSGQYLEDDDFPLPSSGDIAVFLVAEPSDVSHGSDSIYSFNASERDCQFDAGSDSQWNGRISETGIGSQLSATGFPYNGPSVYNTNFDYTGAAEYNIYVDGAKVSADETYTATIKTPTQFKLFANRGAARPLGGTLGEVVAVEDCTTATRQKIEGYLAHKWGLEGNLPSDHPFKVSAP